MARIVTPCQNVCILVPAIGLCRGCDRRLGEIAGWRAMTDRQRTDVMMNLPQRLTTADRGQVRDTLG